MDALKGLEEPVLVEDERGFGELLGVLEGAEEIAVDTEADSFFSYREKVCLIQVTAEGVDYLVDPLGDLDIGGLGEVLADPRRTKVFHDGEYDVLILKRDYGFEFAGLFDTRVAAAALGSEQPGLASVLSARFGIELDKSMQRSDWSQRPLSAKQIAYARLDTRFLVELMHEQRTELERMGRLDILEGECRRLEALDPPLLSFQPDEFVKIKGARKLKGMALRYLRELFVLRDELAREKDQPPFRILNNQLLLELADAPPANVEALMGRKGFPKRSSSRPLAEHVMECLEHARQLGPLDRLPKLPSKDGSDRLDEEGHEIHEHLKGWRRKQADREGYDASLVLNRHVLIRLSLERPSNPEALESIEGLLPWQLDRFGQDLLTAIADARHTYRTQGPKRRRPRR